MSTRLSSKALSQFAPQSYYTLWANHWSIDLTKYPYTKMDFDPSQDRLVPFAVFAFDLAKDDSGERLSLAFIQYRSLFSKSSFTVQVYL